MSTIMLTSKRQATLPKKLCHEMGISTGDRITVEKARVKGEDVWVLRSNRAMPSWFGVFKKYARGKSHRMEDIRASIGRGQAKEMRK